MTLTPPPLRNDCFSLPTGVNWTPVADALAQLRRSLHAVTGVETVPVAQALGRILATPLQAARDNPPQANSAVDGYGFAYDSLPPGDPALPLVAGRAAAGAAFGGTVPAGHGIRILTGATVPDGVDTVVLQEDVALGDNTITFRAGIRRGANCRAAGEDAKAGQEILPKGRCFSAGDVALAVATGVKTVDVHRPLRVAVLSTGDELIDATDTADPHQIYDANRPMLMALIRQFGFVPVDMGRAPDDRADLKARFDAAAKQADVILTSGGASAGDEDHVSALMRESGAMTEWRIALKPGRPLALGVWQGVPVFGLPGNPVAAFVCTLIFARPAMGVLAGQDWHEPQGFDLPAAFEKRGKPDRTEYLRGRVRDGRVEVFKSEGSGRISGLSWSEGLVELPATGAHIRPGDLVRYIPFGSFLDGKTP